MEVRRLRTMALDIFKSLKVKNFKNLSNTLFKIYRFTLLQNDHYDNVFDHESTSYNFL